PDLVRIEGAAIEIRSLGVHKSDATLIEPLQQQQREFEQSVNAEFVELWPAHQRAVALCGGKVRTGGVGAPSASARCSLTEGPNSGEFELGPTRGRRLDTGASDQTRQCTNWRPKSLFLSPAPSGAA